jgi:hypothetical protein
MARIEFNQAAIDRLAHEVTAKIARAAQPDVTRLCQQLKGHDLAKIEPALRVVLNRHGLRVDDRQVAEWAGWIKDGRPVVLRAA